MPKKLFRLKLLLIILCLLLYVSFVYAANFISIDNITLNPSSPTGGGSVSVNWTYTIDNGYNDPRAIVLVSNQPTIRNPGTTGQWLMIGDGCTTPAIPATATSSGGGCHMGSNNGPNGTQTYSSGTYSFNLPAETADGGTFYIIIGMRDYGISFQTSSMQIDKQASIAFTIPLPPPSVTLTKVAENSSVQPGDLILYTINYRFVNSTNFIITDVVPPNCTLLRQSPDGIFSSTGTSAGSTLTWKLGNATSTQNGSVSFLVRVDAAVTPGLVIHNNAHWVIDEIPSGGDSNDATSTVGAAFSLTKSQSVSSASIGDNLTYSFDFKLSGLSLNTYDPFDTDAEPANYYATGGGSFSWQADSSGGYLYSTQQSGSYPLYVRNTPSNFCYGMIETDAYIAGGSGGAPKFDALISFRSDGLQGGKSWGVGISSDHNPGDIWLQVDNPAYTLITGINPFSAQTGQWYTIKVLVSPVAGGLLNIKAKAWPRGTVEPAYQIDYTEPFSHGVGCGYIAFQGEPDTYDYYDNLKVFQAPLSTTDATLFDTVPSQITYVGGTASDGIHNDPVLNGGVVSWLFPGEVVDYTGHMEWWGNVANCGQIINTGSFKANALAAPVDSNSVTINVICPESPTITPTTTPTFTPSITQTITETVTPTITMTVTPTMTMTPTATNTPIFPVIELTKTSNVNPVELGEGVTYTIAYKNIGLAAGTGVAIWDTLASTLAWVSGGTYNAASRVVSWVIGNLAPGASGSVNFTAVTAPNIKKGESITNIANAQTNEIATVFQNTHVLNVHVPDLVLEPVTNYPNPSDGPTTIVYKLSTSADINIKIFTISGELIKTITDIKGSKGVNKAIWDATNTTFLKAASGIYIYRIEATNGDKKVHVFGKLAIMR